MNERKKERKKEGKKERHNGLTTGKDHYDSLPPYSSPETSIGSCSKRWKARTDGEVD
jgi:hypothetical protein